MLFIPYPPTSTLSPLRRLGDKKTFLAFVMSSFNYFGQKIHTFYYYLFAILSINISLVKLTGFWWSPNLDDAKFWGKFGARHL